MLKHKAFVCVVFKMSALSFSVANRRREYRKHNDDFDKKRSNKIEAFDSSRKMEIRFISIHICILIYKICDAKTAVILTRSVIFNQNATLPSV